MMKNYFKIEKLTESQYQVVYRPGNSFCKRLGLPFTSEEQASAAVWVLEYWLDNGGTISVAGDPESPDVITGFDGSGLRTNTMTSVELVRCLLTQGLCAKELAISLLGLSEALVKPYIVTSEGNVELVDLALLLKKLAMQRQLDAMMDEQTQLKQQMTLDDLNQRIMLHHRSALLTELIDKAVEDKVQQEMYKLYLRGYPLNVIGDQYNASYLVVRKQVALAKNQFDRYMRDLLTAKEQLTVLSAELMQAREELKTLRTCFVVREVAKTMPEKPDPEFYEWANFSLKNLFVSLDRFPFSNRASKSLETLGVKRLDQLLSLNFQRLSDLPHIGSKTCSELQEFIRENRLDALQHPIVLQLLRELAEEGVEQACQRLGVCPVVRTQDGILLYDGFESDEDLDHALSRLYSHPSVLHNVSYTIV